VRGERGRSSSPASSSPSCGGLALPPVCRHLAPWTTSSSSSSASARVVVIKLRRWRLTGYRLGSRRPPSPLRLGLLAAPWTRRMATPRLRLRSLLRWPRAQERIDPAAAARPALGRPPVARPRVTRAAEAGRGAASGRARMPGPRRPPQKLPGWCAASHLPGPAHSAGACRTSESEAASATTAAEGSRVDPGVPSSARAPAKRESAANSPGA